MHVAIHSHQYDLSVAFRILRMSLWRLVAAVSLISILAVRLQGNNGVYSTNPLLKDNHEESLGDSEIRTRLTDRLKPSRHSTPQSKPFQKELVLALSLLGYDADAKYTVTYRNSQLVAGHRYTFCLDYGDSLMIGVTLYEGIVGGPIAYELIGPIMTETCHQPRSVSFIEIESDVPMGSPMTLYSGDSRLDPLPGSLLHHTTFQGDSSLQNRILYHGVTNQGNTPFCTVHAAVSAASHHDYHLYSTAEVLRCADQELPYCHATSRHVFPPRLTDPSKFKTTYITSAHSSVFGNVFDRDAPMKDLPNSLGQCVANNPSANEYVFECGHLLPVVVSPISRIIVDRAYCECPDANIDQPFTYERYDYPYQPDETKMANVPYVFYTRLFSCYLYLGPAAADRSSPVHNHLRFEFPIEKCAGVSHSEMNDIGAHYSLLFETKPTPSYACDATNTSPVAEVLLCGDTSSITVPSRSTRRVAPLFCDCNDDQNYGPGTLVTVSTSTVDCVLTLVLNDEVVNLRLAEVVCSILSPDDTAIFVARKTVTEVYSPTHSCPASLRNAAPRFFQDPPRFIEHPSVKDIQESILESGSVTAAFHVFNDFEPFYANPANARSVYKSRTGAHYRTASPATKSVCDSSDSTDAYLIDDHAVVIYGWDFRDNEPHWLVQNSWGKFWGDRGTFKLSTSVPLLSIVTPEPQCLKRDTRGLVTVAEINTSGLESQCILSIHDTEFEAVSSILVKYTSTNCGGGATTRLTYEFGVDYTSPDIIIRRVTGCCITRVCRGRVGQVSVTHNPDLTSTLHNQESYPVLIALSNPSSHIHLDSGTQFLLSDDASESCIESLKPCSQHSNFVDLSIVFGTVKLTNHGAIDAVATIEYSSDGFNWHSAIQVTVKSNTQEIVESGDYLKYACIVNVES